LPDSLVAGLLEGLVIILPEEVFPPSWYFFMVVGFMVFQTFG
jgi:hypothetical protein